MATIRISWVLPTTRVSGNPLSVDEIKHVELSVSTDNGQNYVVMDEIAPPQLSTDVTEAEVGIWKFKAIVVDKGDRKSAPKFGEIQVFDTSDPSEILELNLELV